MKCTNSFKTTNKTSKMKQIIRSKETEFIVKNLPKKPLDLSDFTGEI